MSDPVVGRALELNGVPWTIIARASWSLQYVYLGRPDSDETILRPLSTVLRAMDLGAEVAPDATRP